MFFDFSRHGALVGDRALEGDDDRNFEISQQAGEIFSVGPDPGTKALSRLRYEKLLNVDNRAAAPVSDDTLRRHGVAPRIAAASP